jgi:hypothetical protein
MAFHPFRHFRKHQKAYLAGLTILTMIIFVFSFGAADPIQTLLRRISGSRHGDAVITLYGKTFYEEDLDRLRKHRQLANEFLIFGVDRVLFSSALNDIRKKVERERKGASDQAFNPVPLALQTLDQALGSIFSPPDVRYRELRAGLRSVQSLINQQDAQKNPEQFRALDTIATAMAVQTWFAQQGLKPPGSSPEYFLGGTRKIDDLLDFAVWKQQADKLGIVLTPADVSREVNRAWGSSDAIKPDSKFEANELVRLYFATSNKVHASLRPEDLLTALTDEFRVAMAKEALLGFGPGVRAFRTEVDGIHHSPTVATPDEFLKYFEQQRTTLAVSLLPIAVEKFVPKVERKPSEEDLKNLYAAYKDDEPSPSGRQPGFKEPRRIKVQYFSYRPDSDFNKKLAGKVTQLLPLFRLTAPAVPLPAGGGVAWAVSLAVPIDLDTALRAEYEKYREEEARRAVKYDKDDADSQRFDFHFGQGVDLNDRRGAEMQVPAATLGSLLGNAGTGGTPLAAPVAWLGTAELYQRATLTAYASTVLAGASSSPLVAVTLPTRYLHSARPLETVRGQMLERFEKTLAHSLAESNAQSVRKELDKLLTTRSEEREKRLKEYLQKAVADYGLENFHSMAKSQTRQEMIDDPDPALTELRTAYDESFENPFRDETTRPDFVGAMFLPFEPSMMERRFGITRSDQSRVFRSRSGDRTWVFWRAEDAPAHVQSFETVRKDVENAWYLEQARKLARDEARRIDSALKEQHLNPSDAVKFLREQKQGDVFELTNVAHLVPKVELVGRKLTPSDFRPYQPPKDRIAYPPSDFIDRLLQLKEPGASLVLTDQPVKHFYVAVLMVKPQVPDRREFYDIYSFSGLQNPLWEDMMKDRQRQYEQKLMEQLRAEATKNLRGGEYVLPDEIRRRGESGSSDSGE